MTIPGKFEAKNRKSTAPDVASMSDSPGKVGFWPVTHAFLAAMGTSWMVSTVVLFVAALIAPGSDSGLLGVFGLLAFTLIIFGGVFPLFALLLMPVYVACMLLFSRWFFRQWVFYLCAIVLTVMLCLLCESILSVMFKGSSFPRLTNVHAVLGALAGAVGGYVGWSVLSRRQAAFGAS